MRFHTLNEWLGWLETNHPKEIDLGLERIKQVADRLNLLQPKAKIITVAGTNGKGSCVTASAALLRAAGYKVGVYTSPHLLRYNERIQVNGQPVSDEHICEAFERIHQAAGDTSLTYFEYGTLAAFIIFQDQAVDVMVLEIGLGGRLDAVNILDPDVAVITSIAIDHQDWLGDNRDAIGFEKAGILRTDVDFVCADDNPPDSILRYVETLAANAHYFGKDFGYELCQDQWSWYGKLSDASACSLDDMAAPHLPLPSMAAAIQAVQLLLVHLNTDKPAPVQLTPPIIENTLRNLVLAGRFQQVSFQGKQLVLDVAHNPAATSYLARRLAQVPVRGKTYGVVAMMADKDRRESLGNLIESMDAWWLAELENLPRAATTHQLAEDLQTVGGMATAKGKVVDLMPSVLQAMTGDDRLVVFGSFFTVAAVMEWMNQVSDFTVQ